MALRRFLLEERAEFPDMVIGLFSSCLICLEFGDRERPVTSVVCSTVAGVTVGFLWPVLFPGAMTYHLWQENKERILAKHHHKRKRELWVDDFLVDMDE